MTEELASIIKSCEFHPGNGFEDGLVIRPKGEWEGTFVVGKMARLVFPNGDECLSKIRSFEICTPPPKGVLIETLPQLDNQIPQGTKVYVEKWRPKNVSKVLPENPAK